MLSIRADYDLGLVSHHTARSSIDQTGKLLTRICYRRYTNSVPPPLHAVKPLIHISACITRNRDCVLVGHGRM
jgi:hypothetical protein